ncbi:MAG: LemA family protein [Deltaproteobacteria bacterium]|nr:LemA family protein [Deltaproteobacteria bacterium]
MGTIILLLIVGAVIAAVLLYNGLITLQNQVQNAWRQIDLQLKRRHDLIPNLVETVKGAMQFERETLERVMQARSRAVSAVSVPDKAAAENELGQSLGRLFAVMENYPQLKTTENVLKLQEELTTTENQITFARQFYNDSVMQLNTRQQTFPGNMIAGFFNFRPAEYFQGSPDDQQLPRVDLSLPK